jgi:hypothetical protein
MKPFYLSLLVKRCKKSIFLFAFFLFVVSASQGQVYYGSLSGAIEVPSNNSPGTGKFVVSIDGNFMRVQVTFSGLVAQTSTGQPSGTTASHIHAPTSIPLSPTSTAGVATTTPTFTDFPSGVRSGTYDHTFDMTLASSYNPAYITANGGTPATAFVALKAAIAAGRSYLNIHSNAFPGGEIRGFLLACPNINVSIPNAFALAEGVLPNTVYPEYAPASSLTLQANVSGGTGPYIYSWSNGSVTASTTVSPGANTVYMVRVTDQNGCPGTASKTVNVMHISGGNKGQHIVVCHKSNSLAVAAPAVAAHLGHGDMLGSCVDDNKSVRSRESVTENLDNNFSVRVLSNPTRNYFELQLSGNLSNSTQLRVFDIQGRLVETKSQLQINQTIRIGALYNPGVYLVQIAQGTQMQTLRLVKAK